MTVDPFKPIVLSAEGASLTTTVLPYGLTIHSISTEDGEDFIGGPEDPQDHKARGRAFLNPIIGRFANRLPAGKVEFKLTFSNGDRLLVDAVIQGPDGQPVGSDGAPPTAGADDTHTETH